MTAPTSPKPHTPTDLTESKDAATTLDNEAADAGLRTALTKAIDRADPPGGMRAGTPSISVAVLRTLLAAHPAPETARSGHDIACDADYLGASCICDELTPAPTPDARRPTAEARCLAETSWEHHDRTDDFPCSACSSDTRREDVARAVRDAIDQSYTFEGDLDPDVDRRVTDAVLAVLPAPPVVDEIPEDAPPYLVGVPEGMEWDGLNHDELVELGFDAGVLWGAWDARRRMPVVDEADVRERIAQDIARAVGEGTASDIARGAAR